MLKIHKNLVLDESQKPAAVQIPIEEFERLEEIIENYGLATFKDEVKDDERDTMRAEYDFSKGVRGVAAVRYAQGASTSTLEVTHIDSRGLWLYVDGKEHYMPFDQFPWFADATIRQISRVERQGATHFYWPDLDVDLTLDMIDHPENYPCKYK